MPTRKKTMQRRMQVVTRAMEAAQQAAQEAVSLASAIVSSESEDDGNTEDEVLVHRQVGDGSALELGSGSEAEESDLGTSDLGDDDDDDASYSSDDSWQSIINDYSFFVPRGPEDEQIGEYSIVRRLQRGGFASVFKAQHALSKKPCALKVYSVGTEDTIERELSILMAIRHANVLTVSRLREFVSEVTGCTYRYVVMPLFPKDMANYIYDIDEDDTSVRTDAHCSGIMLQICAGLSAVHAVYHAHGDIKPENILIDDDDQENVNVCICDFGSVYDLSGNETEHDGGGLTLEFAAPEMVVNDFDLISYSVDIFAIACVYVELVTEQPLFLEKENDMLHLAYVQALDGNKPFPPSIAGNRLYFTRFGRLHRNAQRRAAAMPSWEAHCGLEQDQIDFVKSCCQLDPTARPTLDEVIAWFQARLPAAGGAGKPASPAAEAAHE